MDDIKSDFEKPPGWPHWYTIGELVEWLAKRLPEGSKVLEVGPGETPFMGAQTFVDHRDQPGIEVIKCNVLEDRLPFEDKVFDFVYCRHVLEDLWNPTLIMREMSRVAKKGYVETPSPIAEGCKEVEGHESRYRGYHHHHWIIWPLDGVLQFMPKFPVIEHMKFDEDLVVKLLAQGPFLWNTYYPWEGEIKYRIWQNPLDYVVHLDYPRLYSDAMMHSQAETAKFFKFVMENP